PPARRARILAASGARVVLGEGPGAVGLDEVRDAAPRGAGLPDVPSDPDRPAYVIFTSGSTGEPKGVVVSHRAAANTIDDLNARFGVGPEDRCLAVSALDFDLSVYDLFGLLGAGGAVVLVEEDDRREARRWLELVRRWGVTVWNSVPALLDMLLVAAEETTDKLPIRLVLLGGDWVGLDLPDRFHRRSPTGQLVGLGGTTETAIHSTVCEVDHVPPHWHSIPYGTPLGNQRCRVVDAQGRDCPDWVPGELWIGGGSVAEGYQGDPDRTADRFVEHEGARWYRTGDLGRYWPDGTLEFLGRRDHQVKIRGHRIELGEVEAALHSFPGVTSAAVTSAGGIGPGPGGARLVAFVTTATGTLDDDLLRALLADRLPSYMLPERVVCRDVLPLSTNGKVDRKALRVLAEAEDVDIAFEPPAGDVEAAVAAIWAELVGAPRVGRADSFFALGGDSLLATRMLVRLGTEGIGTAEGGAVPLRRLFAHPVLADFAADLVRGELRVESPSLVPDVERRFEPFPLTDVQRAYWLGRAADFTLGGVGSHWYWEFDGDGVDLGRLEDAVNRLVARHEMLRAVFDEDGNQRILTSVPRFAIDVLDALGDGAAERAALREALSHRSFDTSRWPLLDIRAVRAGSSTRLAFSFDYAVLDALSIVIFFTELSRLYEDADAALPSVDVSFRDYVLQARPGAGELEAAQVYWRSRLDDLPPPPQLPLAMEPELIATPRFVRRDSRLDRDAWHRLATAARALNLTPAAVLAAAYGEVLSAWSERPDLTLNLTLFDRRPVHPDIDHVVGDFTSLLLVTHRPEAGDAWADTVRRLQEELWTSMEHRALPATWVLRELARRSQSMDVGMPVVFTSALGVAPEGFDLSTPFGEHVWGLSQTPQVWLDCQVMELDGELRFNWDAVEELFPEGMLDAMFGAYVGLLEWLAAPGRDWSEPLPPLLPQAQAAVRAAVNDTGAATVPRLLHAPFFELAAAAPFRLALAWGESGSTTYGELAAAATSLAAGLAALGVGPGDAVVVSLPKGPAQVEAVLGVLAAGGVYVPVGVDQPPARRARILAASGARVVLGEGTEALGLDQVRAAAPPGAGLPDVAADPDRPAYVIFTSGSTGEPKGVVVSHRAAANTIDDLNARFGVGPDDRALAVSALDFDLSVYDLFGLLGAGGAVVLVEEEDRREARRWLELVRRWDVTVWNSVPALLDMLLVAAEDGGPAPNLQLVLVSGDWVGLDLPPRAHALCSGCRFVAMGGATEAAIWSNFVEVDEVPAHWRSIPYGRPLGNQRYRVVDARGRDCPDWVPGELWIGGAGVAEGYQGDADRTADRFVERNGLRWYRTGDVGRYWPDGTLEFLGRRDHQVKIRGHRIELGEVEAALQAHPAVSAAMAAAVDGAAGAKRLVAFVAAADDFDPDGLVAFLADRLPSAMLPEQVVALPQLPLTENGKLDRAALSSLAVDSAPEPSSELPHGPIEELLAELWRDLLGVEDVGRRDSFFALGGDSLLATRLAQAVRVRFGVELTLRRLFADPTVAGLAELLGDRCDAVAMEEGVL
ncbi:MAG: amino acid adenylation domain-containing protein, partial [Actinobacteria bacterium]|nr:amino acid adenylation domain-containing protein [Actinomycetota bacterium]